MKSDSLIQIESLHSPSACNTPMMNALSKLLNLTHKHVFASAVTSYHDTVALGKLNLSAQAAAGLSSPFVTGMLLRVCSKRTVGIGRI